MLSSNYLSLAEIKQIKQEEKKKLALKRSLSIEETKNMKSKRECLEKKDLKILLYGETFFQPKCKKSKSSYINNRPRNVSSKK